MKLAVKQINVDWNLIIRPNGELVVQLKNTFSWSHSAAVDFETCQRKRYWNKYGKWGGWDSRAAPSARKAYQLDKMDNFYSMLGQAVEQAAMHILRVHQSGENCSADEAYEKVARVFMNDVWSDSRGGEWRRNPKRFRCLREHYYKTISKDEERVLATQIADQARECLSNFAERTMPRIADVARDMELPIDSADTPGDVENFVFEGVKVYAIPDYAYRKDGAVHIHDWKAGAERAGHLEQLAVYGLWAATKHRVDSENILVYAEYLKNGSVHADSIEDADLDRAVLRIDTSIADMTEMLVDGDRSRNEPLPIEEWELALSCDPCRFCNFYELCEDELRSTGIVE